MQYTAPPQYSPDGQWWWNGRSWVRVTWAVQGRSNPWPRPAYDPGVSDERLHDDSLYEEEPRRRTPAAIWIGLIALLALLVLAFGASLMNWASLQGLGGLGIGVQTTPAPPTVAPTAAPTAAPQTAGSGVDGYRQVVAGDAARFQTAGQTVADRCAPSALGDGTQACRSALRSMDDTVQGFQADLSGMTVPACLQPADTQLRTALAQYHQGIRQELDGIDNQDLAAVAQGAGTLSDATDHAQQAAGLLQSSC